MASGIGLQYISVGRWRVCYAMNLYVLWAKELCVYTKNIQTPYYPLHPYPPNIVKYLAS